MQDYHHPQNKTKIRCNAKSKSTLATIEHCIIHPTYLFRSRETDKVMGCLVNRRCSCVHCRRKESSRPTVLGLVAVAVDHSLQDFSCHLNCVEDVMIPRRYFEDRRRCGRQPTKAPIVADNLAKTVNPILIVGGQQ